MQTKCSLLCGAAFGVLLAVGISAEAQAKPKHHHANQGPSALEAKVETLSNAVSDLENRLNDATQAQQTTAAEAEAAKADAAAAREQALEAQNQLNEQIQTIPGQVNTAIAAEKPKLPGGVKVTLGGFAAAEGLYRSKNEEADIGSSFAKIPYANTVAGHTQELRGTARQSRLSVLVQGDINPTTHAAFWGEFDFLAGPQTGNSNESNSYSPRIRNVYATIDWDQLGLHLLAGQNWSLATMNSKGITPRNETPPPTIDAQYVPGFVWARQPQIRLTKDFANKQVWAAVSVENPQTTFGSAATGTGTTATGVSVTTGAVSTSQFDSANTLSFNHIPDVIGKIAFEPMIGGHQPLHAELFGIYRDYYDRVAYTASNPFGIPVGITNRDTSGGGFGGGVAWTVVPKFLDIQGSFLTGTGIGRYGSGQLPDTIVGPTGELKPIPETMFLVGGTVHATKALDLYVMYGQEREGAVAATVGSSHLGYGNSSATLANCLVEGASCTADTQQVDQVTAGFWDKAYTGKFGQVRVGVQYSHTNLTAFQGTGGVRPTTSDDMIFTSFRFYPAF